MGVRPNEAPPQWWCWHCPPPRHHPTAPSRMNIATRRQARGVVAACRNRDHTTNRRRAAAHKRDAIVQRCSHGQHHGGRSGSGGGSAGLDAVHHSSMPRQRHDTNTNSTAHRLSRLGATPRPRVAPPPAAAAATPAAARRAAVVLARLAPLPAAAPPLRRPRQPRHRQRHPPSPPLPAAAPLAVGGRAAAPASAVGRRVAAFGTRRRRGRDAHRRHWSALTPVASCRITGQVPRLCDPAAAGSPTRKIPVISRKMTRKSRVDPTSSEVPVLHGVFGRSGQRDSSKARHGEVTLITSCHFWPSSAVLCHDVLAHAGRDR